MNRQAKSGKGAQSSIRGYLMQTVACLLDAFNDSWSSVQLERNDGEHKVDITWHYDNKTKVVQVKSRQGKISRRSAERWSEELRSAYRNADEYELVLVGDVEANLVGAVLGGVKVTVRPNDFQTLLKMTAHSLDEYLYTKGISGVPPLDRIRIVEALVTTLLEQATLGIEIPRANLDERVQSDVRRHSTPQIDADVNELKEQELFAKRYGAKDVPKPLRDLIRRFQEKSGTRFNDKHIGTVISYFKVRNGDLMVEIPKHAYILAIILSLMAVDALMVYLYDTYPWMEGPPLLILIKSLYGIIAALMAGFFISRWGLIWRARRIRRVVIETTLVGESGPR